MAPRRIEQETLDEDELSDLFASQGSSNSDDTALEKAIAAHLAAVKEKKRQEKEKKFMDQAKALLKKDFEKASEGLQAASKNIEARHTKFLNEYAAVEDRIHHLWAEVAKENQKIEALIQKKYEAGEAIAKNADKQHIAGLSKLKRASQEFDKIVSMMIPTMDEDAMDED